MYNLPLFKVHLYRIADFDEKWQCCKIAVFKRCLNLINYLWHQLHHAIHIEFCQCVSNDNLYHVVRGVWKLVISDMHNVAFIAMWASDQITRSAIEVHSKGEVSYKHMQLQINSQSRYCQASPFIQCWLYHPSVCYANLLKILFLLFEGKICFPYEVWLSIWQYTKLTQHCLRCMNTSLQNPSINICQIICITSTC